MAHPTTYDEGIARDILSQLSKGVPLAEICRDEGMPHPTTFRRWCEAERELDGEPLAIAYARARDDGFDAIAVEALSLLDEEPERVVTMSGDDRSESRIDGASVQRAKNRFEGRLKLLAKWDPKRYGDLIKLSGADGQGPVPVAQLTAELTPAQAAEAYSKLIG
jgi:hypothetical protein